MFEFLLPDVGEGLHEAEIVRWLVAEGQQVERNQPFVEIMTDKSNVEMPAPATGVVTRLARDEGDMIQVGELLIVIDDGSGAADDGGDDGPAAKAETADEDSTTPAEAAAEAQSSPTVSEPARRPKAAPATRRLAAELEVDLHTVTGTGPGGRIRPEDVQAAAASLLDEPDADPSAAMATNPADAPASDHLPEPVIPPPSAGAAGGSALGWIDPGVQPLRGIRRATAKAMDRSWSTIPHISASNEIDATPLMEARKQLRDLVGTDGPPVTPLTLVTMAVARAIRRFPVVNAALDLEADTITAREQVNVGIAVATDHGLMVPVVANADQLRVTALAAEIARLSAAARDRSIRPEEMGGGTHTITNYGVAGTHLATPIIRPGETAITGLGAIAERPIVDDGQVVARATLPVVVCADHRLVDGDVMSAFLIDICETLANPIGLLL